MPGVALMLHDLPLLAQTAQDPRLGWLPVALLLVIAIGFAVVNILISLWIGPKRTGPGKETTYESGMIPVGDTRRRFNVRFYLVAIMFVAFDVEVVIMYPWATAFSGSVIADPALGRLLLGGMLVFVGIILVGFFYDWGKGIFRWD
jgi:NADH-quinone oxidoreductase subunit A